MAEIRKCRICGKDFENKNHSHLCRHCKHVRYMDGLKEREKAMLAAIERKRAREEERKRCLEANREPQFTKWRFVMISPGKWGIVRIYE